MTIDLLPDPAHKSANAGCNIARYKPNPNLNTNPPLRKHNGTTHASYD